MLVLYHGSSQSWEMMKGRLVKLLRKIRLENDEYLKDMTSKTGVSILFLSALENETKKMTESLLEKTVECYHLTKDQEELSMASMAANKETIIYFFQHLIMVILEIKELAVECV